MTLSQRLQSATLVYPVKVTALVFCICLAGMARIDYLAESAFREKQRALVVERAATFKSLVEQQLHLHLRSVSALRAAVQANPQLTERAAHDIVTDLIAQSPAIVAVWMEPAGAKRMVLPLAVAADPLVRAPGGVPFPTVPDARPGQLVLGPFDWSGGRRGLAARETIVLAPPAGAWGHITVFIDVNALAAPAAELLQDQDVALAIRNRITRAHESPVFLGDAAVFAAHPILGTIDYAGGQWITGAAPRDGWERSRPYAGWLRLFMASLACMFCAMMFVLAARGVRNKLLLRKLEAGEAARRQWVADTSHELRTPLTILSTHLEAMADGVIDTGQANLAILASTVEGMQRLVTDLGQLARADAHAQVLHLEAVDIHDLCSDVLDAFAQQCRAQGLSATMDNQLTHTVIVSADYQRLQQVLGNLLSNSLRYTDAPGAVCLTLAPAKGGVTVSIDDTAPGVPDAALPRLFDRFYRVDESRSRACGGSGLGLAICQSIIHEHQGSIEAAHSPRGGLRVSIYLPGRLPCRQES